VGKQASAHNLIPLDAIIIGVTMRITVTLDDKLILVARELTGISETAPLLREALKTLIERESARRLAALGGTMPELKIVPRGERAPQALKRD